MNSAAKGFMNTLFRMLLVLFLVSILSFMLVISSPIDPVTAYLGADKAVSQEQREKITEYWGLDKSPPHRYVLWLRNLLQGDMGESIQYRQPVTTVIGQRFGASLALMGAAWICSGILGFAGGILCGTFKNTLLDKVVKGCCLVLSSTPVFWLGLLIMLIFAVYLNWFPTGLAAPIGVTADEVTLGQKIHHLILPALTLSITGISNIALHTRQKLIDVLQSDYVLFAQARGESKWQIIWRHGVPNIALPAITLQFVSFSELFGGSVLAEQVFSYPGLGSAATAAGINGDLPLLTGIALFTALFVFTGNLLANLFYTLLNPQIKEAKNIG